jgi:hypothetical protein
MGVEGAGQNPTAYLVRGAASRSHLPPSTGSSTASEGDFGVLRGTSIPSEINNMLIPKNPPTGQKAFEGANPFSPPGYWHLRAPRLPRTHDEERPGGKPAEVQN